jgi:hypothetical protein
MMVVDMQGINELFTDPQIHTAEGGKFGDGNLGPRGMALFLNRFSHATNPVVQYLGLPPFHMAENEQQVPLRNQVKEYKDGLAYLESKAWQARMVAAAGDDDFDIGEERSRAVSLGSIGWNIRSAKGRNTCDDLVDVSGTAKKNTRRELTSVSGFGPDGQVLSDWSIEDVPMVASVEAQVSDKLVCWTYLCHSSKSACLMVAEAYLLGFHL